MALGFTAGCKSLKNAVPQTHAESYVIAPAREMADIAFMRMLQQAMLVGVISSEKELNTFLVYYYNNRSNFWDIFRRKKFHGRFSYKSPKDTDIENVEVTFDPQEGFKFTADKLKTSTNPEVIITSGDAQYKITTAEGEAFTSALNEVNEILEKIPNASTIKP